MPFPLTPHLFILFGATGDLARNKLYPALYRVWDQGGRPDSFAVLGVGRSDWSDGDIQERAVASLAASGIEAVDADAWARQVCFYANTEGPNGLDLSEIIERVHELESRFDLGGNRVFYLALPPSIFDEIITGIGEFETSQEREGWTRLVIEKPFGHDLASARHLNEVVHAHFQEEQVYRIDHFLGKETVQNLLVFRFANALFESSWDRDHIEEVEITVAETNDAEGRTGYFDGVGTVRDMIQNHLTQILSLTAMEPPARLDAEGIRREKIKVLKSIPAVHPDEAVLGQYGAGGGKEAYTQHAGVDETSQTNTYAAVRLHLDTWRWQGVPFVLRTGKRLRERFTEIIVRFRRPPVTLFQNSDGPCDPSPNLLKIRLQPNEGFRLSFEVKTPGENFQTTSRELDFDYGETFGTLPDAYETLLRDIAEGDATLFVHAEETEEAWRIYEPLLEDDLPVHVYESGTWGPEEAQAVLPDYDPDC